MKVYASGIVALFLAGLLAYPFIPLRKPDVQAEMLNATVRVELVGKGGTGSGTAISPTRILTNHHVISAAGEEGVRVRGWVVQDGKTFPVTYAATVIASDESRDLALLEIDEAWAGAIAIFAAIVPGPGEAVCKSGSALGRKPMVTCGLIGGLDDREIRGLRHWLHSSPTAPGDSGGGLYVVENGAYRMVAVTRALGMIPAGMFGVPATTFALAVPLDEVLAFLDEAE